MINYYLITKPGIVLGNLITIAGGFLLASKGQIDLPLFFSIVFGLSFIIASACVFNNYIDRDIDKKMERTKDRVLPSNKLSIQTALLFGTLLFIAGNTILFFSTNLIAILIANFGFFVYVFIYSLWKRDTIYGTAIGSIAGAVPPVIGYVAVTNKIDMGAIILFGLMILWQMPHFYSIAIYHFKDYKAADLPVLPVKKGMLKTKIHMALYILAFLLTTILLTVFNYAGYFYLASMLSLSFIWLAASISGFKNYDDQQWGQKMFHLSLLIITCMCLFISIDTL